MKILCVGDVHWSQNSSILRSRGEYYSTRLQNLIASVNWRDIFSLLESFGNIDMSHVDDLVKEVKTAKDSLQEDNLDLLKRIVNINQPNSENLNDLINASIVSSLDKVSDEELAKWHEKHDVFVDLDSILGEKSYETITQEITDYFANNKELGDVTKEEVQSVYDYLKSKNQDAIKIDPDDKNYQTTNRTIQKVVSGNI